MLSGAGAKRGTDEAGLDGDAKRQRVEPPVAAAPPTAVAPTPSSVESAAPAVVAEAAPALMSETATPSIEMAEAGVGADERMATAASASEVDALSLDKDTPLDEAAGDRHVARVARIDVLVAFVEYCHSVGHKPCPLSTNPVR